MIIKDVLQLEVDTAATRNLIRNPSGEYRSWGWTNTGDSFSVFYGRPTTIGTYQGPAFARSRLASASAGTTTGAPVEVTPGQYLSLSYLRIGESYDAGGGLAAPRTLTVSVEFFNAGGASLSTATLVTDSVANAPGAAGGTALVPALAKTARISFSFAAPASGLSLVWLARVMVQLTPVDVIIPWQENEWTDLLGTAVRISTEQGNELSGVEDVLSTGSLVAVIHDAAADPSTNRGIRKGAPIRLRALVAGVPKGVWAGNIETADTDYDDRNGKTIVTITATDPSRPLIDAPLGYTTTGGFGQQIAHAAGVIGVTTFNDTGPVAWTGVDADPDDGDPIEIEAREDSAKASDWIRRACNTHGGYVWVDVDGRVQQRLISYLPTTPEILLTDDPDEIVAGAAMSYTGIGLNYGSRGLTNVLEVVKLNVGEPEGSKVYGPYQAMDSVIDHGSIAGKVEITSGSPSAIAGVVLPVSAQSIVFPTELRLRTPDDLAAVLKLAPYVAVRVKRTGKYDDVVRVLRVRHEIAGSTWTTSITARPLETASAVAIKYPAAGPDTGPGDVT